MDENTFKLKLTVCTSTSLYAFKLKVLEYITKQCVTVQSIMVLTVYSETPALLSDNAPLLPEKCCNYKCFGIHMFIYFVYKKSEKKIQI